MRKVSDYCIAEVSDQAVAVPIALACKIPAPNRLVHSGQWDMGPPVCLHHLQGRTLCLMGFGKGPQALAAKAKACGLLPVACDPYIPSGAMAALGVRSVSMDELDRTAGLISVHALLTPEMHHLFNASAFARMKPGALLVTTARRPGMDVQTPTEALDKGELAGAALDVLPKEPLTAGLSLLDRDDVILMPHIGHYSVEVPEELETKAADEVLWAFLSQPPRCSVNRDVVPTSQRN